MEIISKIFDVINNKIALPVAIFCALLLYLPTDVLARIELDKFAVSNKTPLALSFLFSCILYLYEKSKQIIKVVKERREKRKRQVASKDYYSKILYALDDHEHAWIYYCLRQNTRTIVASAIDPTATSLESKGIISRPKTPHNILDTPFTITDSAWDYLLSHKEKFCNAAQLADANYNRWIDGCVNDFGKAF